MILNLPDALSFQTGNRFKNKKLSYFCMNHCQRVNRQSGIVSNRVILPTLQLDRSAVGEIMGCFIARLMIKADNRCDLFYSFRILMPYKQNESLNT
ncbi:hypothetical protein HMPREF1981_01483 [Bacteroides pyogenes F0041]|uniref:Uncharacterized protein n=1 Tax=Bacteroides pyogenes F0041 TaxID=1321819 RepID=U2C5D5_9BACE|nr:hypothetical protein HMPREF1981_01483 [Bacteroides pyogenes F0041]MBB3894454.1 hypothetical protein [Bacteroides pyogenes]SUV32296.1 Uncharacterised protein [Bacteroides pyogenes]